MGCMFSSEVRESAKLSNDRLQSYDSKCKTNTLATSSFAPSCANDYYCSRGVGLPIALTPSLGTQGIGKFAESHSLPFSCSSSHLGEHCKEQNECSFLGVGVTTPTPRRTVSGWSGHAHPYSPSPSCEWTLEPISEQENSSCSDDNYNFTTWDANQNYQTERGVHWRKQQLMMAGKTPASINSSKESFFVSTQPHHSRNVGQSKTRLESKNEFKVSKNMGNYCSFSEKMIPASVVASSPSIIISATAHEKAALETITSTDCYSLSYSSNAFMKTINSQYINNVPASKEYKNNDIVDPTGQISMGLGKKADDTFSSSTKSLSEALVTSLDCCHDAAFHWMDATQYRELKYVAPLCKQSSAIFFGPRSPVHVAFSSESRHSFIVKVNPLDLIKENGEWSITVPLFDQSTLHSAFNVETTSELPLSSASASSSSSSSSSSGKFTENGDQLSISFSLVQSGLNLKETPNPTTPSISSISGQQLMDGQLVESTTPSPFSTPTRPTRTSSSFALDRTGAILSPSWTARLPLLSMLLADSSVTSSPASTSAQTYLRCEVQQKSSGYQTFLSRTRTPKHDCMTIIQNRDARTRFELDREKNEANSCTQVGARLKCRLVKFIVSQSTTIPSNIASSLATENCEHKPEPKMEETILPNEAKTEYNRDSRCSTPMHLTPKPPVTLSSKTQTIRTEASQWMELLQLQLPGNIEKLLDGVDLGGTTMTTTTNGRRTKHDCLWQGSWQNHEWISFLELFVHNGHLHFEFLWEGPLCAK